MPIKFSKEEQAFIDGKLDPKATEEFLVKNIGNMELNDRLYRKIEEQKKLSAEPSNDSKLLTDDQIDNLKLLERSTYKTPTAQEIRSIANKIKIAKQLQAQDIELLPEEKISLLELKQISRFSLLLGKKDSFREGDIENTQAKNLFNPISQDDKATLQGIYEGSTNKEFKELYENMVVCEQLAADLRENILNEHPYQAGDILIRNEAKSAVIENVAQEGITPLDKKPKVILFDKNIDNSYINDAFEEDWDFNNTTNSFTIEEKSENLKQHESDLESYQKKGKKINSIPSSSAAADVSKINVTDILSSDTYRFPENKLNQTLFNQIHTEKDPKKLEALLIANGAEKVSNSIAEEFVRTEDVKKSKSFNNLEDNLANTLETLAKSAKDQKEFVDQAKPRIEAYLAVSGVEVLKPDVTPPEDYLTFPASVEKNQQPLKQEQEITTALKNLYADRNKTGLKAEIIKFISSTLVTLGLKKSTTEKTVHAIKGKFTKQLEESHRSTGAKQRM
jgi:hypothetical protein